MEKKPPLKLSSSSITTRLSPEDQARFYSRLILKKCSAAELLREAVKFYLDAVEKQPALDYDDTSERRTPRYLWGG
ncbi:MAG: hypothetical protein K2X27_19565 [Candidatus Obscuribacterales bacterium]|nr:hypothetical protein [Candidatus Obscuribacterales bacterium]